MHRRARRCKAKQGRHSKTALTYESYLYSSTDFAPRTRGVKDLFRNHDWALFLLIASKHSVSLATFGWPLSPLNLTIRYASDDHLQSISKLNLCDNLDRTQTNSFIFTAVRPMVNFLPVPGFRPENVT